MKRSIVVLSIALATLGTAPAWAQNASVPTAQSTQSTDSIVQMRSEIRTANSTYKARVKAANKVRDQAVAKARAERDKAVEAARSGSSTS
ncbi:hypothetical protein [Paraburkholderia graminis]|uniref:Uncharacterized protein n=1 Tax=Paraburkholderia graminis TaxID=60548 RepID=A0ABD5CSU7_9BURK|nr:hypothetical protein [Paraburkholderia graminis]MDR6207946.1 hypothetical protein [Paraburkholderia graminis]